MGIFGEDIESKATLDEAIDRLTKPLVAEIKNLTAEVAKLGALIENLQIQFSRR